MLNNLLNTGIIFWLGWIILPVIVEFIPSLGNFILLIIKRRTLLEFHKKKLDYFPNISIIVPIYNSSATLEGCLRSIAESNYDINCIEVMCIDNGSKDNSFDIFQKCQLEYPDLAMNWMKSANGKSKALNKAIYNCEGKYIINIDSDGQLEKDALYNIVKKFEYNQDAYCMTGAVLIDPNLIDSMKTKNIFLNVFRKIEFMEYCQAFLAGRNFQAETNTIFTLSGAFSAFKKSTLLKTRMYNTETICEDTQLTFQVKEDLKQKVSFCENAIFMVDPIESFNKYYTQRQRWQIGELEVAKMYIIEKTKNPFRIFFSSNGRLMLQDHTFSFPKSIWFFVMFILCFTNRSWKIVGMATLFIYLLSALSSYLYFINVRAFLDEFKSIRRYYEKHSMYIFLLPMYNLFSYFVRFCGILNSINRKSSWRTNNFSDEWGMIKSRMLTNFSFMFKIRDAIRKVVET